MPTDATETPEYTADDIIERDRWYSPERVEELLGVLPGKRVRYVPSGREEVEPSALYFRNVTGDGKLIGREVLAWLKGEQIDYQLTAVAVGMIERRRRAERPPAKPQPSKDPIARANAQIAERQRQAEENERLERAHALTRYYQLLSKGEAEDLDEPDIRELTDLVIDLELTAEKIEEDRRLIAQARRLLELHDARDELNKEARDAATKYLQMRERHKQEERELYLERHSKQHTAAQAAGAGSVLLRLCRQRPEFFQVGRDVPRLKPLEPEK